MTGVIDKLRAVAPVSVAGRGVVLIIMVASSIAIPGACAHYVLSRERQSRHEYESEAFLAAALSAYLEQSPATPEGYDEYLVRIAERGKRVRWAGLIDAEGLGYEFRRRTAMPIEQIITQVDLAAREPRARALEIDGARSPRFELLSMPLDEEGITLVVVLDRGGVMTDAAAMPVIWSAAAMLLGLAGSWAWFHFGIASPIRRLGRRLVAVQDGLTEVALDGAVPAELEALAASVAQSRQELEQWRGEATHLRHTVETRIDAGTRKAARERRTAQRQADTDALTKLGNRRVLERELPRLFEERLAAGGDLALITLDVNHFKQLNDKLGHDQGDDLLVFIGALARATIRKGVDYAIRTGGDEFVLILPDANTQQAEVVARRLGALFAQKARLLEKADPPPGLSAGIASLREHGARDCSELLRMADQAMYHAKRTRSGVASIGDVRAAGQTAGKGVARGQA